MWKVTYQFGGNTYSASFKVVPGQTGTEAEMRLFLSRKTPTWEILSVELSGPLPDDPGPQGAVGVSGKFD